MSFGELDLRLGIVPRWVILPMIQKQCVATHCFLVERIARHIAVEIFGITEKLHLDEISQWALHHDDEEALIGDIPTPGKRHVSIDRRILPQAPSYPHHLHIVKIADLMETFFFIVRDIKLGNGYVLTHAHRISEQLRDYIRETVTDPEQTEKLELFIRTNEEEVSDVYPPVGSAEEGADRGEG